MHLLDPTTASVLELLEGGATSFDAITTEISARFGVAPNPGYLELALGELNRAGLLEDDAEPIVEGSSGFNRRELVRKMTQAGVAAVLIPAIATLTATHGYAQGTAPNRGVGNSCANNSQCISGDCCNGICSNTGCPQANGAACTAPNQCSSVNCVSGVCTAAGAALCATCTTDTDCASGNCGSEILICVPPIGVCQPKDGACATGCDCCSGDCDKGHCKKN